MSLNQINETMYDQLQTRLLQKEDEVMALALKHRKLLDAVKWASSIVGDYLAATCDAERNWIRKDLEHAYIRLMEAMQ